MKYLRFSTLKEEKFILGYDFGGVGPWLIGLVAFGPVVRQHIIVGVHSGGGCPPHDCQEAKRETDRTGVPIALSSVCPQ
jgi:hypothetical protein